MYRNVLDSITESAAERLEGLFPQGMEYRRAQNEIDGITARVDECGFTEEERGLVDDLVSAYVALGTSCIGTAYREGFLDGASLFAETGLVRMGERER